VPLEGTSYEKPIKKAREMTTEGLRLFVNPMLKKMKEIANPKKGNVKRQSS
jgi:hypothetical protein